jgi:outer membrane biosynthesis protein TonB
MPSQMTVSSMTRSVNSPTFESHDALRRSVEPPELWLVRLFGALVLHLILLAGVRSAWVKISVPEKADAGAIEFVEVGTVESDVAIEPSPKAEGVAPLQNLKPGQITADPDQTTIVAKPTNALPSPSPSAVEPAPQPIESSQPADPPKNKPADSPKNKPADSPKNKPADSPKNKPADSPKNKPTDPPKNKPPIQLEVPVTEDGRVPGDIQEAPAEPIKPQPGLGMANVKGIQTQLSAEFQRANQISGSLQVTASRAPQLIPVAFRQLPPGTVLQLQVVLVMENATQKLVPDSIVIRTSNVKGIPVAIQRQLVEGLLVDAVYEMELVSDSVNKPILSDWDANVEITIK